MSKHSFFSPSKSVMWINCPGSMAFPENQVQGESNTFADDGTASHEWSALALQSGKDVELFIGSVKEINGKTYTMDQERADFCQIYIDDVRRRAIGGKLFVEYHVDLSHLLGEDQGGTADAAIILGDQLIIEDLKYGTGEKVYASYDGQINPQLGLYLLGMLRDAQLLGHEIKTVTGVICQPRLGHIDEYTCTVAELSKFSEQARISVYNTGLALKHSRGPAGVDNEFLNPAERTCRWCRAKAECPALKTFVTDQVRVDFQDEAGTIGVSHVPALEDIAKAYIAVPLVEQWCSAVRAEVVKRVTEGVTVIGPDSKPYKFIEGEEGRRQWTDETAAEALLLGQLGDKAYAPRKILTAPAAGKLLDKKKTAELWKDAFQPLIKRARGQPQLVLGSDPRPVYNNVATAEDFSEALTE